MNRISYILFLLVVLFFYAGSTAQEKLYTPANGHAHNDYLNKQPFYEAYRSGFGSIEADIFPVNGVLHVAHHQNEIRPGATLQSLYIKPLQQVLRDGKKRPLILLIDIKADHQTSLSLLQKEIEPLKAYLNEPGKPGPVTIVISGERPSPEDYKNFPLYIYFDADLKKDHTQEQWSRVALVSLAFNRISKWKGETEPAVNELEPVKNIIDSVHGLGKPIRFWAAPDTKLSWQWQKRLGVDLVGTDRIQELYSILRKEDD